MPNPPKSRPSKRPYKPPRMLYKGGLCFITDITASNLSPSEQALIALRAGARFIQYRRKDLSRRALYEEARLLRDLTAEFGAALVINDHADIALAVRADGAHLGQDDLPLREARRILGPKMTIGVSTHNIEEAMEAEKGGADYVGFGAIFPTKTKDTPHIQGLERLRSVAASLKIPVVAIGGIGIENADAVLRAGASCVAVASAILKGDIEDNVKGFLGKIGGFLEK